MQTMIEGKGVIKILVIEDNEDDFVLLDAFLDSAEFALTWSSSASQARRYLQDKAFDLILLDHGLPDTNALTFVRELTTHTNMPPIIVLTGMEDQTLAVSAIKQGAANYILKDEIIYHLLPAISEAVDRSVRVADRTYYEEAERFVDTADNIYETLVDTMTEGCVVVSRFGQITFVNSAMGQLMMQSEQGLLGCNVTDLLVPASQDELAKLLANQMERRAANKMTVFEGALLRPNLETLPVRISARPLNKGDATLIVLTDISAQLQAREHLARLYEQASAEQSRLQAIIESSWDGLMFITISGKILNINSKTVELLGLSPEHEWTGRTVTSVFASLGDSWALLAREIQSMLPCVSSGVAHEGENCFDSKIIQWQMISVNDMHKPIGLLVVLRDQTEVRSAENMRDDLTRALVHDLRNPLTSILSSLELIQRFGAVGRNTLSDKQAHYVRGAIGSTLRVSNLVTAILDMEQLESGEMPLDKTDVSLAQIANDVVAAQTAVAVAKQIRLEQQIPITLPTILLDRSLIQRVLQNLVDNAVKFTSNGGSVLVSAERTSTSTTLRVRDSGDGIPPEVQKRLFQRFAAGNQKGRGSGLGLAFCKLVVETHGGRIWVESTPGLGAAFYVELPNDCSTERQDRQPVANDLIPAMA